MAGEYHTNHVHEWLKTDFYDWRQQLTWPRQFNNKWLTVEPFDDPALCRAPRSSPA